MFKLDENFLIELGLGALAAADKNKMLSHIYETLEMRVGMKLAEKMSNDQLDEFESFINNNNESGALKWLESNFPNYKQVVAQELEKLKSEIMKDAPQIVAHAASQGQQQPVAGVGQQPPMQQQPQRPPLPQQPVIQQSMPSPQPQQQPVNHPVQRPMQQPAHQPILNPMPQQQPQPMSPQQPQPTSSPVAHPQHPYQSPPQ